MARHSVAACNAALSGINSGGYYAYALQNTGDPGTTGANEYPSTTRVANTMAASSGGAIANSAALSLTNSGTTPVTYISTNTASTSGTFGAGFALGSAVTAANISVAVGALVDNAA